MTTTSNRQENDMDVEKVLITADHVSLEGALCAPPEATGIVLFAHGSGSSRHSPRNQFVAAALREARLGTLLFDLLLEEEESIDLHSAALRFDVAFLAERLVGAIDWISRQERTEHLPIGLFGSSTGAGAALVAAAQRPRLVGAVVSRGGRPDMAAQVLPMVEAPTLLLVGGKDRAVIELNQRALALLRCEKKFEIIPGAAHLFEEPGALEQVSASAREWFRAHL
ncbi:MAG TPA: dienelactone hydrolase family protein [Verrucomicrobiae bacterium]|jgi:pimeloyl-ACP methyl ester carboxylesterase|nr:dienelactone hydrolase family protein [Verrucomicrobiae bacterium]